MPATRDTSHTAAAALNNVGVSLLERGRFHEACEAFSDATTLILQVVNSSPDAIIEQTNNWDPQEKVEKANRSLAGCRHGRYHNDGVQIISQDEMAMAIRSSVGEMRDMDDLRSAALSLIRIECTGTSPTDSISNSLEQECSIILYNLGNAHMCMAKEEQAPRLAAKHHGKALKLLTLSHSILANVPSQESELVNISLAILVLRSLVRITTSLERTADAQGYFIDMRRLKSYFEQFDILSKFFFTSAAPAA